MSSQSRFMFLASALLSASFAFSQAPSIDQLSPELRTRIDAAAEKVLHTTGVPSASLALVRNGKVVYTHAYGLASLNPKVSATVTKPYAVGSISKQFTATALLLLQQQGKLSIDDPVSKFFPDLTRANEVTLRMLLSHTSGYQDYWPEDYLMTTMLAPTTAQAIVDKWAKKPLDFDPGTKWQYSNTNYVIAGMIFEKVSGTDLFHFLQQNIFAPLKMTDVYNYDLNGGPLVEGYIRHALAPLRPAPKTGTGWVFAAGELAMPAYDLALWDISIIDQAILSPASYAEFEKSVKLKDGTDSHYGLGVDVLDLNGHKMIAHSGEVSGFTAENIVVPEDHVALAVLTNQDASPAAGEIARDVLPLLVGQPLTSPQSVDTLTRSIFTGLQHGKLDRSLFTQLCNEYFTAETIGDYASSLAPLGEPTTFHLRNEELRGGMTFRVFDVSFSGNSQKLQASTYTMPDGKLEQFLVYPVQ